MQTHTYVQHTNRNCSNDFPSATNYMLLTLEMAAETYRASQAPDYHTYLQNRAYLPLEGTYLS